jgi:hypothetical protein
MEGTASYNGHKTYTPLDLFDFSSPGTLSLSNAGGYFSITNGSGQPLGQFNNASKNGGDIADWASYNSVGDSGTLPAGAMDPFDAFSWPGYNGVLSAADLLEMQALGYSLTAAGQALA